METCQVMTLQFLEGASRIFLTVNPLQSVQSSAYDSSTMSNCRKSKTTSINHCNFPKCAKIHKTRVKEIQRIYYTCPTYSKCFEALTIYFKKANSILLISSVDVDYGGPWPVPLFHHHVEVIKCKKSAKEMRRLWGPAGKMYVVVKQIVQECVCVCVWLQLCG